MRSEKTVYPEAVGRAAKKCSEIPDLRSDLSSIIFEHFFKHISPKIASARVVRGHEKSRIPLGAAEPEGRASGGATKSAAFLSEAKKKPATTYSRTGGSRTTLGDGAFDFRVRNGNGYGSSSMVTGKKPEAGS